MGGLVNRQAIPQCMQHSAQSVIRLVPALFRPAVGLLDLPKNVMRLVYRSIKGPVSCLGHCGAPVFSTSCREGESTPEACFPRHSPEAASVSACRTRHSPMTPPRTSTRGIHPPRINYPAKVAGHHRPAAPSSCCFAVLLTRAPPPPRPSAHRPGHPPSDPHDRPQRRHHPHHRPPPRHRPPRPDADRRRPSDQLCPANSATRPLS